MGGKRWAWRRPDLDVGLGLRGWRSDLGHLLRLRGTCGAYQSRGREYHSDKPHPPAAPRNQFFRRPQSFPNLNNQW